MLVISLQAIKLIAPVGLYPQEHVLGNAFEVDVDIHVTDQHPWPFIDYTIIHQIVVEIFHQPGQLLETFTAAIHEALKLQFPESQKIKVQVRKLNPPMPGQVAFAQITYEA